jgi:hypothetical protein
MAKSKAKLTSKQVANLMKVTGSIAMGPIPDCEALFAAAEAIASLIAEHCPIAKPTMKQATKKPIRKAK